VLGRKVRAFNSAIDTEVDLSVEASIYGRTGGCARSTPC
jgi:hypothetical protein